MAEVIDLDGKKRQHEKDRREKAKKRAVAVAGALTCGLCPHRCAHCGLPIKDQVNLPAELNFPLCGICLEEYQAYKRKENGEKGREAFWHTEQWFATWRTWLEYMRTSDEFRRSPAFLKLIQDNKI